MRTEVNSLRFEIFKSEVNSLRFVLNSTHAFTRRYRSELENISNRFEFHFGQKDRSEISNRFEINM